MTLLQQLIKYKSKNKIYIRYILLFCMFAFWCCTLNHFHHNMNNFSSKHLNIKNQMQDSLCFLLNSTIFIELDSCKFPDNFFPGQYQIGSCSTRMNWRKRRSWDDGEQPSVMFLLACLLLWVDFQLTVTFLLLFNFCIWVFRFFFERGQCNFIKHKL